MGCGAGGAREAARIGVLSRVDRNLAEIRGDDLFVPPSNSAPLGLNPIERAIFQCCSESPVMARNIPQDTRVSAACAAALGPLIATGLVPDASARAQRLTLTAIAGAVVIGIGVTKLAIAAERGRSNVGFLGMLMVAA